MKSFQGCAPVRLSSRLLKIVEDGAQGRPNRVFAEKATAVEELSRLFTKGRQALGTDYLKDPALAGAYLSYFFPVNLAKIQALLDELPIDWHRTVSDRPPRVLDLGTGPGTGALATLDWLDQHGSDSVKQLTIVAVDASAAALNLARLMWDSYSRQQARDDASLILQQGDLARSMNSAWRHEVAQQGPYDLIIIANCLNELFGHVRESIDERARLIAELIGTLTPHGTLMIVEPALRETSRALHQVRDQLMAENRCTVYSPCLHHKKCPALIDPDDWCHEERAWEAPLMIQQIDREVGFIKDALKFSYLLLRTDGRTIADRSPATFRMVSELRKLKGDTRAWLCNELGRSEVGRLDRARSAENAAWDGCERGTIIRVEGLQRKAGAALSRIPVEGTVKIVRPI